MVPTYCTVCHYDFADPRGRCVIHNIKLRTISCSSKQCSCFRDPSLRVLASPLVCVLVVIEVVLPHNVHDNRLGCKLNNLAPATFG